MDPAPPEKDTAVVQVLACNFVSTNCRDPVTGLTVSLCDKRDVNCSNPIRANFRDAGGIITFDVNTGGALGSGFDGFLKINSPTELCTSEAAFGPMATTLCGFLPGCDPKNPDEKCRMPTFAPSLLFFNPPIRGDSKQPVPLPLVPTSAFPALASAANATVDPTKGNIFITALDCDGMPAPGVSYEIAQHQDTATSLYVDNGVVSDTNKQTDRSGIGGFLGIPPGFAEVVGVVNGDRPTGLGKIGVQTAPFTITYSSMSPGE